MNIPPDVEVTFEFNGNKTNRFVRSGYRPCHLVRDDYLTTGVHHYYGVTEVPTNGKARGTITFLSPEAYPACLWPGKRINIQEGATVVGNATIEKVFNPILLMTDPHARTALLLGPLALETLARSHAAVFGVGGVGGHAAEALARSGIGALELIDGDTVSESNLNRQIVALHSTLGQPKAQVMAARAKDINPACKANARAVFFDAGTACQFDFTQYDYVLDCIDSVTSKLLLVELCHAAGTKIISCMGAGNKLDPSRFEIADIYKTGVCPLARVMRRELRKRGIPALKVVYSREEPVAASRPPGSVAFVPSVAGLIMAGEVVRELSS